MCNLEIIPNLINNKNKWFYIYFTKSLIVMDNLLVPSIVHLGNPLENLCAY